MCEPILVHKYHNVSIKATHMHEKQLDLCKLRCHVTLPSPRQSASLFGDSGNEMDA